MHRDVLEKYLNELLDIHCFQDYCPNGLQVEGRHQVENIVSGVTASLDLLHGQKDRSTFDILFFVL